MKAAAAVLLLFLFVEPVSSEPQIKHFFPARPVLLGQPLFWTVEIRHPLWESYQLKLGTCPDLKMAIADEKMTDVAGEIRTVYRVAVTPVVLKSSCTPSLTISDEKGQTTVLNGKGLRVQTISGESLAIKNPVLPPVRQKSRGYYVFLFTLLSILGLFCAVLAAKRAYNNLPSRKFLRDVRKASAEVKKNRLPIQVWRLLRSEMVWGFQAEVYTPAQLQQRGSHDSRLTEIASTLQSLEGWRYSASPDPWDRNQVQRALAGVESLVEARDPLKKIFRRVAVE